MSVLGLGYLGATQAIVLAEQGHTVLGIDPDPKRVALLQEGHLPFFEPGLKDLLEAARANGRLSFSTEYDERLSSIDVHLLCVGTPAGSADGEVDLSAVFSAGLSLGAFLKENSVVVGRSTVPVGTAEKFKRVLSDASQGITFSLAWNPEFLSEGTALADSLKPDRIVVGAEDDRAVSILRTLYEDQIASGVPFLVMDIATSELVKVASNSFLAMKISYINGVAEVAEKSGASTAKIAEAMGLDPRIGKRFIQNGLGFGGGCLPKDLLGFTRTAEKLQATGLTKLLSAAVEINAQRISAVIEIAKEKMGDLEGRNISVLGIAFKPNTDDSRESAGRYLAMEFSRLGANVSVHDPIASKFSAQDIGVEITSDLGSALASAELVVVATEWPEYAKLYLDSSSSFPERFVIDGRSVIESSAWIDAGWSVIKLGEGQKLYPSQRRY